MKVEVVVPERVHGRRCFGDLNAAAFRRFRARKKPARGSNVIRVEVPPLADVRLCHGFAQPARRARAHVSPCIFFRNYCRSAGLRFAQEVIERRPARPARYKIRDFCGQGFVSTAFLQQDHLKDFDLREQRTRKMAKGENSSANKPQRETSGPSVHIDHGKTDVDGGELPKWLSKAQTRRCSFPRVSISIR